VFSPSYIPGRRDADLTRGGLAGAHQRNLSTWPNLEDAGKWRHGWQPDSGPFPPEIYRFDACLDNAGARTAALFKHHFFCKHPYFMRFNTSDTAMLAMDRYLAAEEERLRAAGIAFQRALLPPTSYRKR
jgi:hypothetical protein